MPPGTPVGVAEEYLCTWSIHEHQNQLLFGYQLWKTFGRKQLTLYYRNAHLQTAVAAYHTVQEKQEVGLSNEAQKEGGGGAIEPILPCTGGRTVPPPSPRSDLDLYTSSPAGHGCSRNRRRETDRKADCCLSQPSLVPTTWVGHRGQIQ